jgi:hypothetical protein
MKTCYEEKPDATHSGSGLSSKGGKYINYGSSGISSSGRQELETVPEVSDMKASSFQC